MRIEFRLEEVLRKHGLLAHGVKQDIAKEQGLNHHTIGKIFNNQVSTISLNTLQKICEWLHGKGVPLEELPGSLLALRVGELWEAVSAKAEVAIYLGEQVQAQPPAAAWRWIARRDSQVASAFAQVLSMNGASGKVVPRVSTEYVPYLGKPNVGQGGRRPRKDDIDYARTIFETMRKKQSRSNAIIIGSQKVNYLVEYFVADLFNCFDHAFCHVKKEPKTPFFLVYRKRDRGVESCWGGWQNPAGGSDTSTAGIHFCKGSAWSVIPWKEHVEDGGIVVTSYCPGTGAVELAVIGFSGRATEAVGNTLIDKPHLFWPPEVTVGRKSIGVYLCHIRFGKSSAGTKKDTLGFASAKVIALDEATLKEYLR